MALDRTDPNNHLPASNINVGNFGNNQQGNLNGRHVVVAGPENGAVEHVRALNIVIQHPQRIPVAEHQRVVNFGGQNGQQVRAVPLDQADGLIPPGNGLLEILQQRIGPAHHPR